MVPSIQFGSEIFMLGVFANKDAQAVIRALDRSQARIEFDMDGRILSANETFLAAMGYSAQEIVGQHHRLFVDPEEAASPGYAAFWAELKRGEHRTAEFRRLAKGGREVWLQASYNPVKGRGGRPRKVVKLATDITAEKLECANTAGQIAAIGRSQAVIEFAADGTIRAANENFLAATGYTLGEIVGRHHRMFVEPTFADGAEYRGFWERLNRGEFESGEFRRFGKGGREIWLQATYNPIVDVRGRLLKIVKYASDITAEKQRTADLNGQIEAINRSQAVIHFALDGTILQANDNFLAATGYRLDEIRGQHHRLFVEPADAVGNEYAAFWRKLNQGSFHAGIYRRVAKSGAEIWLQATYNPVLDASGRPVKVVKYATDITAQRHALTAAGENATQTLANVQAVAAAAEEMNASVAEIARNMTQSQDVVDGLHTQVASVDASTERLTTAARSMDGVVQFIQQIASQITLLALNATIESARAGAAGKGFAVVASEVKALASQTATATLRISEDIQSMQAVSGEVVGALAEINGSVGKLREFVGGIAGAVQEQNAATREISYNMQTASTGVAGISRSLDDIAAAQQAA